MATLTADTEPECCCDDVRSRAQEAKSPYTLVADLPDNDSNRSSPVPKEQYAPPAINVNVNVQVESAFDSNVFLEEVKKHISNAIDEVKLSQQEALKELRESAQPLMIGDGVGQPPSDSLDLYCPDHRAERIAEREQQWTGSPRSRPVPKHYTTEAQTTAEAPGGMPESEAPGRSPEKEIPDTSPESAYPSGLPENAPPSRVSLNEKVADPRDPELFPRRPSEEEFTREGRYICAADQPESCLFSPESSQTGSVGVYENTPPPPQPPSFSLCLSLL